jgi:hypothetical protein
MVTRRTAPEGNLLMFSLTKAAVAAAMLLLGLGLLGLGLVRRRGVA